jgi:hypothetical protein
MAIKIRDIENEITGLELKNSTNEAYFPVDIDDGLTYRINRNELIDFILKRGTSQNILGTSVYRDTGNDANEIPYFITNSTGYGIMIHTSLGGVIVEAPNSAFNKTFSNTGGTNGTTQVVARADHTHAELSAITLENNPHIAVFEVEDSTSFPITEQMLKDKMNYVPVKDINPAIGYTIWTRVSPNLIDVTRDFVDLQVEYQSSSGTTTVPVGYTLHRFKQFTVTGLSSSKSYVVKINFVDDGGMAIPVGGVGQ